MGRPVRRWPDYRLIWIVLSHRGWTMADAGNYWFEEGAHAFKAGIALDDLLRHYPEREMRKEEWDALEQGWMMQKTKALEESGQARLF